MSPPDFLCKRAAQYARKKLNNFEYIELWYFTPDGCTDTTWENVSTAEDMLSFTHTGDNSISLRPLVTLKPSKNVMSDADLSWRQMSMGKTGMLISMKHAKWSDKHWNVLASFFYDLGVHPYWSCPNGKAILLIYQAWLHHAWHDGLTSGKTFNIAIVRKTLKLKLLLLFIYFYPVYSNTPVTCTPPVTCTLFSILSRMN